MGEVLTRAAFLAKVEVLFPTTGLKQISALKLREGVSDLAMSALFLDEGTAGPAGPAGAEGPAGPAGTSVRILGTFDNPADLPSIGALGDGYLIDADLWVWNGAGWENVGNIRGPVGPEGPAGADSTVPGPEGPAGPAGADSIVPGPAGADSTVPGPEGPAGPAGADSTVPGPEGPAGADSTVPGPEGPAGPAGADSVVPGPPGADSSVPGPEGPAGPAGADGTSVTILGQLADEASLPASADPGDAYLIDGDLWVWTGDPDWENVGTIQGPVGPAGPEGPAGPAGADSTVVGPEGPAGPAGADSTVPGPEGPAGPAGADSVVPGPTGPAGADSTVPGPAGADSTVPGPEGPEGPAGPEGDSAYDVAVANGFVGSEAAWLASWATAAQGALADTAVQPARSIAAGTGLTGGGNLSADRTIGLDATSVASLAKADTAAQPSLVDSKIATAGAGYATTAQGAKADTAVQPARQVIAGTGLTGGGTLSADRTVALSAASIASDAKADTAVQPARTITAGAGLAGGGDLSANRTLSLSMAATLVGGTTHTFGLTDAEKMVQFTSATAVTATVPPNSTVPFPIGTLLHVAQDAAGKVTVAPGAGVTFKIPTGFNPALAGQNSVLTLAKVDTDTWRMFGHQEETVPTIGLSAADIVSLAKADSAAQKDTSQTFALDVTANRFYVGSVGSTANPALRLAGTAAVGFATAADGGTVNLIAGAGIAAQFSTAGSTAASFAITVITREKGDARYAPIASSLRYKEAVEIAAPVSFSGLACKSWIWGGALESDDPRIGTRGTGLIAEDVAAVDPGCVHFDEYGRPDGLNALALIGRLVDQVNALSARIAQLEAA